jgi:hypothetical protein
MDHARRKRRVTGGGLALALLMLGGCRQPTEVVVVADTDLEQFVEFDYIEFQLTNQFGPGSFSVGRSTTLPATIGMVPADNGRPSFDVIVTVNKNSFDQRPLPLITRRVSNIPFASHELRSVFVPLLRDCMCNGTSCPNALEPACADIDKPVLTDFDEDDIPRLQTEVF